MSQLPKNLKWEQASNQWPATLNPVIASPLINGQQIDSIQLLSGGPNNIYHSLGQLPQGWFVVDKTSHADVIRTQPFNQNTITLEADADCKISIWIY